MERSIYSIKNITMAHNRYFIIDKNDSDMSQIEAVMKGALIKQRPSVDVTLLVIKLHEGDHNDYPVLSQYVEYNNKNIVTVMRTPEWTPPDIF